MLKSCLFCAWEKTITKHRHVFFCAEDIPWICGLSLNKKVESSCFCLGPWTFNYWFWSLLARQTPSLSGAQKSDERRKLPRKLQEHMERHALNKQGENRHPFPSFDPTCFFVFEKLPIIVQCLQTGWAKKKPGEYLGFGRHYLFRPGSWSVGPFPSLCRVVLKWVMRTRGF